MKDKQIQSVLFDLDGTLKVNVPNGMEMFLEFARELGIPVDDRVAKDGIRWNHWYWAQSSELLDDLALQDELAFWVRYSNRLLGAIGVHETDVAHATAITRRFADYAPEIKLNEGALETLQGLRSAGYTLGLVSNRSHPLDEVLDNLGLEGFFEFTLAAGQVGIWKPDAGIFFEVIKRYHCQPDRTIYVGDNYYADVVSSSDAGLLPVLLDPEGVFEGVECKVIGCLTELLVWLA